MQKVSEKKEIVMHDSEGIVEYRTNVKGWVGKDGKFYGKNEEHARYMNSTHIKCECGEIIQKMYSKCDKCRKIEHEEAYNKLPFVEWDGTTPLAIHYSDRYFFDENEVREYCEDNELNISELQLVLCQKMHMCEVNIDEWNEEYSTEDHTLEDFHPEIIAKCEELNELIRNTESKIWCATDKRTNLSK